jgi:hypothetical protein
MRPARLEVSTPENLRLARPEVEPIDPPPSLIRLLTDKAFNATTPTNMPTAPPAWEQHPCLILLFTAHPRVGGEKDCHYSCHVGHCSTPDAPSRHNTTTVMSQVFWAPALFIPRRPPQLRPDPASTTAGQQRNNARTSTTGDRTSATAPRVFHRPITDITATPREWPPLLGHVAIATSTVPTALSPLRHRLRTPRPPLDPIKGKTEDSPRGRGTTKTEISSTLEINISSNTLFSLFS